MLRRGFGLNLRGIDLVGLQYILYQCPAAGDTQLAITHTEIRLDDAFLHPAQARIRLQNHVNPGHPVDIRVTPVVTSTHQVRLTAKSAEYEVAVILIFFTIRPHMPAHAGVDERVRGNYPVFRGWVRQRYVLTLQA